jgi:hypothetical protein
MVLRLKKLAARSGSSAALHRFIGHILLSVLSGNTCVLPTLAPRFHRKILKKNRQKKFNTKKIPKKNSHLSVIDQKFIGVVSSETEI